MALWTNYAKPEALTKAEPTRSWRASRPRPDGTRGTQVARRCISHTCRKANCHDIREKGLRIHDLYTLSGAAGVPQNPNEAPCSDTTLRSRVLPPGWMVSVTKPIIFVSSLLWTLIVGFADWAARRPPPYVSAPPHHPFHRAGRGHGGPDVEVEDGLARRLWWCRVEVDHIANLLLRTVHVARDIPVVAIERRFSAGSGGANH